MPKSFWKGVINFGLVAIPVRMYVATQARTPNFHLLHRKCLTRPKQVHYCEKDNEYFNLRDTTRGYEYSRNQFVVLSESDFDKVSIKTTRAINISTFVDANAIDPIYYYGSHYVAPEDLGLKPFNLFREALRKSNRMAIAKVVFQKREHLCSLRPHQDILVLQTIHYPDEILTIDEIGHPKAAPTSQEMEMALFLITAMTGAFEPAKYRDDYEVAIRKVVEAKLAGKELNVPEVPQAEFTDLIAALRASLDAARKVKE